jgi:hypothetical protein
MSWGLLLNEVRQKARWFALIQLVAIAPVLIGLFGIGWSVANQQTIRLGRIDAVVLGTAISGIVGLLICVRSISGVARAALLSWSVLVVLLVAEFGLHLVFRNPASPWPPHTQRVISLNTPLFGVQPQGTFSTNALGLRGSPIQLTELREIDLSVLCLGGSTTECFYNSDEACWTGVLQQILKQRCATSVFVGNAGRGGHLAAHHEYQLKHYRYVPEFDVITVLCGWNDLSGFLYGEPGQSERDIPSESLVAGLGFEATAEPHVPFYRNTAVFRLFRDATSASSTDASKRVGWRAVVQDPYGNWIEERRKLRAIRLKQNPRSEEPEAFRDVLILFGEQLERIRLSVKPGQTLVLMTQPTLCMEELPESLESRLWSCNDEWCWTSGATAKLLQQMNVVIRDFCEEYQIRCVDLEGEMTGRAEYFYDDCHFTDAGCQRVAALVADCIQLTVPRNNSE